MCVLPIAVFIIQDFVWVKIIFVLIHLRTDAILSNTIWNSNFMHQKKKKKKENVKWFQHPRFCSVVQEEGEKCAGWWSYWSCSEWKKQKRKVSSALLTLVCYARCWALITTIVLSLSFVVSFHLWFMGHTAIQTDAFYVCRYCFVVLWGFF